MTPSAAYLGRHDAPPGLRQIASGKVRDIYELDDERLLFVTTDRVSAFDVVMDAGIPDKGRVLTSIAAHWFERTADLVPNHLLSTDVDAAPGLDEEWRSRLRGRTMIVQRCEPDPIEWVVRGYIEGSGWKEYVERGTVCGIDLPPGLVRADQLPEPLLTPTTKHEAHDRPLHPREAAELIGPEAYAERERICLALFERGRVELAELGILLADTKFELGTRDGKVLLIDEALTPDSSRFWPASEYAPGSSPPSFDKQILRNHLETLPWNKEYPPPHLEPEILAKVGRKYLEIAERITGHLPDGISA